METGRYAEIHSVMAPSAAIVNLIIDHHQHLYSDREIGQRSCSVTFE
jgi:hypothetical protein